MFSFQGAILNSKSWLNRALVIRHFNPQVQLDIDSAGEDVVALNRAICSIGKTRHFDLGLGGTSFRFFAFLISRQPGKWKLTAHSRLLERPQKEIGSILQQLGVATEIVKDGLIVESRGWQPVKKLVCSAQISSQFVTALILSCWDLEFDLEIEIHKPVISFGYLNMTFRLLQSAGMSLIVEENENSVICHIKRKSCSTIKKLNNEPDISSAFALASAAVIAGSAEITNWNGTSDQPDLIFLNIFEAMGIQFRAEANLLSVARNESWRGIDCNLSQSPDLFPVLAVLCAFAEGNSTLSGGHQLRHKESDRIAKTKELLELIQVDVEPLPDGLRIKGGSARLGYHAPIQFNPDHDHRMAMAAALLRLKGFNISILHPEVVNKSYPLFWRDVGLAL